MPEISVHHFAPRYGVAPKLVPVEAEEVMSEGQRLFSLRRPGAPRTDGVLVSPEGYAIASFFDGARDLRTIQRAIFDQYGQLLYVERIHELARALLNAGLLEKPLPPGGLRRAVHAGSAYEDQPGALRATLDSFFEHTDGPGARPQAGGRGNLAGIVVPHIDFGRGGAVYAHAYKALAEGTNADLFVIFGTAHASPPELFTLTRRHYDTPFGPAVTDASALAMLEEELGDTLFLEEAAHDEEHSIEFQAVYLKYLLGSRPFTVLPVLCSSLYGCSSEGRRPDSEPAVERFLAALSRATEGRKVCYIAAADLSHVGLTYGDATAPTSDERRRLAQRDLESLRHFSSGDPDAFFDHVGPDAHTRRICGLTPIYMTLRATEGARGRLLKYSQWFSPEEGSAVTYAAATLER
jgi:AmmeMemoRadiSam system protein B